MHTLNFVVTSACTLLGQTDADACGSHTLLGLVVQLYSPNVIQSVYTCTAFCWALCSAYIANVIRIYIKEGGVCV